MSSIALRAAVLVAGAAVSLTFAPLSAGGAQQPAARPQGTPQTPRRDSAQADTARGGGAGGGALGGLRFRSIGPALTSGRIGDIAVHPRDPKIWYLAVASGGVWKTTNAGSTWTPVFDSEASYSIANVVIDPNNPNIVWVGTGENNAQRSVAYGDGVYKSIDGGRTWANMGLKQSEHIGKIVIDPTNSDIVYVAAQGPLSTKGGERGLYQDDRRREDLEEGARRRSMGGRERRRHGSAQSQRVARDDLAAVSPRVRLHRRRSRVGALALDGRRRDVAQVADRFAVERRPGAHRPRDLAGEP